MCMQSAVSTVLVRQQSRKDGRRTHGIDLLESLRVWMHALELKAVDQKRWQLQQSDVSERVCA